MSGRNYNRQNQVYSGKNSASAGTSYKDKVLSTLYNPFSIKNNQPKWPDGLATYSIGRKQQFASEIYGKDITLVLFPGSINWCIGTEGELIKGQTNNNATCVLNHGDDRTFNITVKDIGATLPEQFVLDFSSTGYSAWRGVSYAMKIRCCNTDEENDGWFEAIRTSRNTFLDKFGVVLVDDSPTTGGTSGINSYSMTPGSIKEPTFWTGSVLPNQFLQHKWEGVTSNILGTDTPNDQWYMHTQPSYATGKLKDIGDVLFMLNPERDDNEFTKIRQVNFSQEGVQSRLLDTYQYATDGTRSIVQVDDTVKFYEPYTEASSVTNQEHIPTFQESLVSDSFDMIILKIHSTRASRILVHSVANIELLTGEFSPLAQFQTVAYSSKDALNAYIDYRQTKCKLAFHTSDMYSA